MHLLQQEMKLEDDIMKSKTDLQTTILDTLSSPKENHGKWNPSNKGPLHLKHRYPIRYNIKRKKL